MKTSDIKIRLVAPLIACILLGGCGNAAVPGSSAASSQPSSAQASSTASSAAVSSAASSAPASSTASESDPQTRELKPADDTSTSSSSKDNKEMYLYADYLRNPTEDNWKKFMATAPVGATFFVITTPPAELKELVSDSVSIDETSQEYAIAVSLYDDSLLSMESGEIIFKDNGEMLWKPDKDGKLYEKKMKKGEKTAFKMTIPEGIPCRLMEVTTASGKGIFPVGMLSGEWNQMCKFIIS